MGNDLQDTIWTEQNFACITCGQSAVAQGHAGTKHRNHCPFCLTSKHVDDAISGDRASSCQATMRPVALTFKQLGNDKYGKPRVGDVMIVHACTGCGKISINRIAADDDTGKILGLLHAHNGLKVSGVQLLTPADEPAVRVALFGKSAHGGR
ncbi:MAG: RNHCP domain-containing protein [Alphaproteobacteria bacterium]